MNEDLKNAARKYAIPSYMNVEENYLDEYPYDKIAEDAFIAGAEWQEKQDLRWAGEIHKNGYDLCKEQMLKDAVEVDVIVPIYEGNDVWSAKIKIPGRYEPGDKVRIIIVKED